MGLYGEVSIEGVNGKLLHKFEDQKPNTHFEFHEDLFECEWNETSLNKIYKSNLNISIYKTTTGN